MDDSDRNVVRIPEGPGEMSATAGDGDQLGLWPLAETETKDVAATTPAPKLGAAPRRRRKAAAAREQRDAAQQEANAPGDEIANLWGIDEVSRYLAVSKDTIYGWRKSDYGPPAIKVGKHLRWQSERVVAWVEEQELRTSEGSEDAAEDPPSGVGAGESRNSRPPGGLT